MNRFCYTLLLPLIIQCCATAQVKIGNNAGNVNPNSLLELESTTKGLLLPRMSNEQIRQMSGVPKGMLVFSSTDSALYLRRDTGWAILSLAPNRSSATNQWSGNGDVIFNNTASKIGVGTSVPFSQLSNTPNNTIGSDNYGGNPGSLSWAATQLGYVGQIYNGGTAANFNGMAIKVNSNNATALDISQGSQGGSGAPLLVVKSSGKIGVGTAYPTEALEVQGNIKYSGTLQAGVVYPYSDVVSPVNSYAFVAVPCPAGTKLIGGGGGQRDINTNGASLTINYSGPDKDDNNRWLLVFANRNSVAVNVRTYAICARVE